MNRTQRVMLVIIVTALVATWLYPSWIINSYTQPSERGVERVAHPLMGWDGYRFLFTANDSDGYLTIDWGRLLCTDAIIVTVGALLVYLRK